jgi:hypothetical protein
MPLRRRFFYFQRGYLETIFSTRCRTLLLFVLFFLIIRCLIRLFGRLHTLIRRQHIQTSAAYRDRHWSCNCWTHGGWCARCCSSRSVLAKESRRCNRKPQDFEDLGIKIDLSCFLSFVDNKTRGYERREEAKRCKH